MKSKRLFLSSIGISLGLAGMILEVCLMVVLKKLELLFFFYFDFVFYYNFRAYMLEKYRLEGRDQYGIALDKGEAPITDETDNSSLFQRHSEKATIAMGVLIILLLLTLVVRIWVR
jgi:hypothetical protein